MIEKKTKKITASIEWLSLYINLETRKVTEFENEKIEIMDHFIGQNKDNFNNEDLKFSSKIKKCEVCDNWSIVKGDQDHENAHWEGKITEVTSSNLLGKFHGEREVMIFKSLLTAEGRVCKFCYKAKVSFCLSVNQISVNQKKC